MMVNDTNCQVMVISGLIFQLMVINVVKTMPFLPPIGPWEWFIYTTICGFRPLIIKTSQPRGVYS